MENKTIFFEKVKTKAGEMLTLVPIKRIGMGVLICAVIVGAGSVYWHQQRINEHTKIIQARARMIEAQAAKQNITLLDSEKIKGIVAEAIGIDGSSIEYRQIELTTKDNDQHAEKDVEYNKDYKKLISNNEFIREPAMMQTERVGSTAARIDNVVASYPVYKVACKADGVKYRLSVDAVTGRILTSRVIGD